MTRNEFLNFLKTDPIFKVADKQLVATLYESPFDNVVIDEGAGTVTITFHGEEFQFDQFDDPDLPEIINENPSLATILPAKRVIITAGFSERDVVANGDDITGYAVIQFNTDDGGDDGGLG